MATPSKVPKHHLAPLNTHWHNRSLSSLSATSEAATFHSAHAHLSTMELRPLSKQTNQPSILTAALPLSTTPMPSPKLTAIKMDRQDSGYAESPSSPTTDNTPRTSTSSCRRNSPSTSSRPKRRTTNASSTSSTPRASTKRASRSSAQVRTSNPGSRPTLSSRHTTPYTQQPQYQFFQFPVLTDPSASSTADAITPPPPPPPPATVQYWTSDSTRRLEYAAIDAASKGVRGFFIKLLPDCILPAGSRRMRFCERDGGSDAGSVRRYRLVLPEEKECGEGARPVSMGKAKRPGAGVLRRWTTFGKRGGGSGSGQGV